MGPRVLARWSDKPYVSVDKRYDTVEHRITAGFYPNVGADVRHEIRSDDRGIDDWTLAEKWEFRDHGIQKIKTERGEGLP
jgi:hypothetical protein